MRYISAILIFSIVHTTAVSQQKLDNKDLRLLRDRMTGHFTSEAQSVSDSANYFNIHLHMVPIWENAVDGYWLYVEQAAANSLDKPYRQRIYQLHLLSDTIIASRVYEFNNPLKFAGAWDKPALFSGLSKDSLVARQGCAILLKKNDQGDFFGSTPGKECKSSLRGGSYATSEAFIYKDKLVTWDRGWNADDKQVWGATKGGYFFIRK